MGILYCGISSKYIHTMPAGWFLSNYLSSKGISISEIYHNVNEPYDNVLKDILDSDCDKLLFSVYIFNVNFVKKLIADVKRLRPSCIVIVGGPEVTEDFEADNVIIGEGEKALYNLLLQGGGAKLIFEDKITDLDDIPSPYSATRIQKSQNKLIYYESCRGCPFHCTYCMASLSEGVRYFSLERVKSDLINIAESGAKIIKFTDRTFNANASRTNAILEFIMNTFADNTDVCFHFEVGGDLFRQSTLDILEQLPPGLVQMEAGVQTLNTASLKAIKRVFDVSKFTDNISRITSFGNIHLHLDLIAGLPMDTLDTFKQSFNKVFSLRPSMLQLGFLKLLKGTPIRQEYAVKFCTNAPYEVISTPTMSEEDFAELKQVEWVNDKLYNSGKFSNTLEYLLRLFPTPYDFFLAVSAHFNQLNIPKNAFESTLYEGLLTFRADAPDLKDILRFDYLITNNSRKIPKSLQRKHSEEFKKFLSINKSDGSFMYEEFALIHPLIAAAGAGENGCKNAAPLNEASYIVKFDYRAKNRVNGKYNFTIELINLLRTKAEKTSSRRY